MHLVHVHILTVASAEAHNLGITDGADGVEPLRGEVLSELHFHLIPKLHIEVEGPKVLQVRVGFPTNGHHVLPDKAASMVSPGTRHRGGTLGLDLFNEDRARCRHGSTQSALRVSDELKLEHIIETSFLLLPSGKQVDTTGLVHLQRLTNRSSRRK